MFFSKTKTAYVMRISDWSSGVCSSDLEEGERQAHEVAGRLAACGIRRIIASPYWRTLHTAEIIAETLGLPVTIEPQVRERYSFVCDVGSHRSDLCRRWPHFAFGDLPERWWPEAEESEEFLAKRCRGFRCARIAGGARSEEDQPERHLLMLHLFS